MPLDSISTKFLGFSVLMCHLLYISLSSLSQTTGVFPFCNTEVFQKNIASVITFTFSGDLFGLPYSLSFCNSIRLRNVKETMGYCRMCSFCPNLSRCWTLRVLL